jgi:hypothetical protein
MMFQLLAAMLLATSSTAQEEVILRLENNAGCAVRVQVLQFGSVRHTMFVHSGSTVMEKVRVPSPTEPLSFRVIGVGCPFTRYTVEPLNQFETALVLKLHNMPILASLAPYLLR